LRLERNSENVAEMENPNIADSDPVTNKVEVDLHMLRALVPNRVVGEVHGAKVVTVDECGFGERVVELTQMLLKPSRLCHTVSNSLVLRLGTGARDNRLPLGRPRDKVAAQEHSIVRGGAASVRAASPVSIGVDN
jgi:hypothetical protein